jgi:hypothetical protein
VNRHGEHCPYHKPGYSTPPRKHHSRISPRMTDDEYAGKRPDSDADRIGTPTTRNG